VRPGFFDEHAAIVAKDRIVREIEDLLARQEAEAEQAKHAPVTFRAISNAYLEWLDRVKGAKPSTLRDHRYLLAEPTTIHRRGKGVHAGLIMAAFGDRPAVDVTTSDVNKLLDEVAARGTSSRTVNKHRQLLCAVYNYASSAATFNLEHNPAAGADRRPEPEPARLDYYSPAEVEALASALADGAHRDPEAPAVDPSEAEARAREDAQDADLVRVAAYTGLRRGELLALRWRDVELAQRKLIVRRSISANQVAASTKSRKAREVPIPDQAAVAIGRLRHRDDFVEPDDFVFTNRWGRRIDGSALRRRVARARDATGLRELRFHDLRHTYGSLLVAAGVDLASVKSAMGHSRITTTERYLHARSASELAGRFTRAFASE
jgi:integrase